MTPDAVCLKHATVRSVKIARDQRRQFCACGATRVVWISDGSDGRVRGAIRGGTSWTMATTQSNQGGK